jgi:Luciferase-like monooxygenase
VRLARTAEEASWEGIFVWDLLAFAWGVPSGDPWVILAAVAASTTRLKVGTIVTPLARRRPVSWSTPWPRSTSLAAGAIFGAGAPANFHW